MTSEIFLDEDTRRFADVIEEVCAAIQSTNDWNADLDQRQRIIPRMPRSAFPPRWPDSLLVVSAHDLLDYLLRSFPFSDVGRS